MEPVSFNIEKLFLDYLDSLNDYELYVNYVGEENIENIDETLKLRDRLSKEFKKNDGSIFPILKYFSFSNQTKPLELSEDLIVLFYKIECYLYMKRGEYKEAYNFFIKYLKPLHKKRYELEKLIATIIFKENVKIESKIESLQKKILKTIGFEEKIKSGDLDEIIDKIYVREKELNIYRLESILKDEK